MTETTTETTELTVNARVKGTEKVEPWNGFLWRAIAFVVSFFPTYRDTRDGRSTRNQMRVVIVIIGLVLLAIGGTADEAAWFWILLGMLIACLAFVLPVEELKMRSWRSTLKKKQKPREKTLWDRGRVEVDERYVALYAGDDRVRRVGIKRGKHDVVAREHDNRPAVGVLAPGAKKDQSIWLLGTGDAAIDTDGTVADNEMDRPAKVDPDDLESLWHALQQTD